MTRTLTPALVGSALLVLACAKAPATTRGDGQPRADGAAAEDASAALLGSPFGGGKKLSAPGDCRTALLETTSCRGEDRSFQECLYYFRADGVPRPDVCRAFLKVADNVVAPDAGGGGCNELSPSEWKRAACAEFSLPADFTCFSCTSDRPEAARQLVQAFTAACDRAIVLKGCNVDPAKGAFP